jgi:hypothetical protein
MKTFKSLLKAISVCIALVMSVAALPSAVYAQKYEVHPYAGAFFPGPNGTLGDFRSEGIYGVKSGVFVTTNFQVGGHLGYINHFEPNSSNPVSQNVALDGSRHSIRAVIWEGEGSYHFPTRISTRAGVTPYVVVGLGGLTTATNAAGSVLLGGPQADVEGNVEPAQRTIMLQNGDTFFTFSYGGGIKAMRLLGPVGLRADIRGRTIPNFLGNSTSWPELTGGFTFNWGER